MHRKDKRGGCLPRSRHTLLVLTQGTGNGCARSQEMDCPLKRGGPVKSDSYLFTKTAEGCSLRQIWSDKSIGRSGPTGSALMSARCLPSMKSLRPPAVETLHSGVTNPINLISNDYFKEDSGQMSWRWGSSTNVQYVLNGKFTCGFYATALNWFRTFFKRNSGHTTMNTSPRA